MSTKVTTLPEIEGVEQLDAIPAGARVKTANFYSDEADLLVTMARGLRERKDHCICPATGWPKRIYKKASNKSKLNPAAI